MNWLEYAINIGYKCDKGKEDISSNWYGLHKYYMPDRVFTKSNRKIIMSMQGLLTRHPVLAMCFPTDSIFPFNIKPFTDKKEYDNIRQLISKMSVLYIAVKEGENYIYETFANMPPPIEIL